MSRGALGGGLVVLSLLLLGPACTRAGFALQSSDGAAAVPDGASSRIDTSRADGGKAMDATPVGDLPAGTVIVSEADDSCAALRTVDVSKGVTFYLAPAQLTSTKTVACASHTGVDAVFGITKAPGFMRLRCAGGAHLSLVTADPGTSCQGFTQGATYGCTSMTCAPGSTSTAAFTNSETFLMLRRSITDGPVTVELTLF